MKIKIGETAVSLALFACLAVASLGADDATLSAVQAENLLNDAHARIDVALANRRKIPTFVTTVSRELGRGVEKVVRFIKNTEAPVQMIREERSVEMPRMPTRKAVFVQNYEGFWELHERDAIRFMFPFRSEPTIPSRMAVAQKLCADQHIPYNEEKALQCAMDPEAEYFGTPCTKITLSLSPEMRALAVSQQQPLSASASNTAPGQAQSRSAIPGTFVYYVAKTVPFVICWQAYGLSGAKINEVSYQEFEVRDHLDEAMFTVPKELKVITIPDRAAYQAYIEERMRSTPGKPLAADKK